MMIGKGTFLSVGLIAGALGLSATTTEAMPALSGQVAAPAVTPPNVEKTYCGYYGCHRYYRGYYRPHYYYHSYGYRPYYGGYGYGPHVGIGIGGIGIY